MNTSQKIQLYISYFLLFGCILSVGAQSSDIIEANIRVPWGAGYTVEDALEWHPDGSVTVNGELIFMSPIKKFQSATGPYVSSNEMILVDPAYYASRLNKTYITKQQLIDGVLVEGKSPELRAIDYTATEGGYWYIDMKANEGAQGETTFRVAKRRPFLHGGFLSGNTEELNYGYEFSSEERYVIFGGQLKTSSTENVRNLNNIEDFRIAISNPYESTEYAQLFNKPHYGDPTWWMHHPGKAIVLAGAILSEVGIFEELFAAEFFEVNEAVFATDQTALQANVAKFGLNESGVGVQYESIKAAAARSTQRNSFFQLQQRVNYFNRTKSLATIGTVSMVMNNNLDNANYDAATKTFTNVPELVNYNEYKVENFDDIYYTADGDEWFTDRKDISTCVLPSNQTGDPLGTPCVFRKLEPVVVKMNIKDATVNRISFPGYPEGLTPYQLFGNLAYEEESKHSVATTEVLESFESDAFFSGSVEQKLPQTIIHNAATPTASNYDVTLNFDENEFERYIFYLISDQTLAQIKASLPLDDNDGDAADQADLVKFLDDLGTYSGNYKLYKVAINKPSITLSLNAHTYLGGNSIVIEEYSEADLLFINTPNSFTTNKPLKFKDANGNNVAVANRPETDVVVNGSVAILDEDTLENQDVYSGTEEYGLFVGKVGDATSGILANGMAILDSHFTPIPDFVFEETYDLNTLSGLEQFLQQNKHLPNVPSQQDYKDKGHYSVQKMLFGQLQNLEELYLHSFNQEESLQSLQSNTKSLTTTLQRIEAKLQQLENQK
jgi:hypothetical protein